MAEIRTLDFIEKLEESEFVDLLVAIKQMRYGDNSRLYEYFDKEGKRNVHLWDNGGSFKDNGQYHIWINDYGTSIPSMNINHNICMLYMFGKEWYLKAKQYFEHENMMESLEILNTAVIQYEKELEDDKEITKQINTKKR